MSISAGRCRSIPHITDAIKERITGLCGRDVDLVDRARSAWNCRGHRRGCPTWRLSGSYGSSVGPREHARTVHLTLVPYIADRRGSSRPSRPSTASDEAAGDRYSGRRSSCVVRNTSLPREHPKKKIGLFCNVAPEAVFEARERRRQHLRASDSTATRRGSTRRSTGSCSSISVAGVRRRVRHDRVGDSWSRRIQVSRSPR